MEHSCFCPRALTILTVDPSHTRRAAAGAGGGLTGAPILAQAELAAVLAKGSRRAGCGTEGTALTACTTVGLTSE